MSVSDTEASDLTWTDNGTFNLSEGHTPQTENSEGTFIYHHVALDGCVFVIYIMRATESSRDLLHDEGSGFYCL